MPRLYDRTLVDRPLAQTQQGLERFFASLRGGSGVARFRLRVPMDGAPHGYGISLDRDVRIEVRRRREPGLPDAIEISWRPEGMLVFPSFEGTLAICSESDRNVSRLELEGSYTPPFGVAGMLFDAAIGHRIAQATAREFLKDVKNAIEGTVSS